MQKINCPRTPHLCSTVKRVYCCWQEKLKAQSQEDEKKKTVPYLWNLNEDAALSVMLTYFCESGETLVGKKANDKANIKLNGVG